MVYALQLYWVRNHYLSQGRTLAEAVIASAKEIPHLEGEAAFHRKVLIAKALSTLSALAMGQGDLQYLREVSAKCEGYAYEVGDKVLVARTLAFKCEAHLSVGNMEGVEAWCRDAVACAQEGNDPFALGMSLGVTCQYLLITGKDPEKAREAASQGTKILQENGLLWGYALVFLGIGMMAKYKGDFEFSRETLRNILPLFVEMGDTHQETMIQSELGHMERYEGHLEKAEQIYRATILVWQRIGHRAAVANQLESLAFIASAYNRVERAARLLGAAEALREKINIQMSQFERSEYDKEVAGLRNCLGEPAFSNRWSEGCLMTMEQAVEFAVDT